MAAQHFLWHVSCQPGESYRPFGQVINLLLFIAQELRALTLLCCATILTGLRHRTLGCAAPWSLLSHMH